MAGKKATKQSRVVEFQNHAGGRLRINTLQLPDIPEAKLQLITATLAKIKRQTIITEVEVLHDALMLGLHILAVRAMSAEQIPGTYIFEASGEGYVEDIPSP